MTQSTEYRVTTRNTTEERPSDQDYAAIGAVWGLDSTATSESTRVLMARNPEAAEQLMERDPSVVKYERALPTANLTASLRNNTWTVTDSNGGVWWPNDPTAAEIAASTDAAATAVRICDTQPTRGEWRS